MPRIKANGLEFEYEEYGSPDDPLMLLVNGFSNQMTSWPESFKQGLAATGRRIVIYDNRDIGLSAELEGQTPPSPKAIVTALSEGTDASTMVPYILDDMAADAAALIEALGAKDADVLGVSMGGMIVQLLALNHPDHVRTLIPVMTTSGDPTLPNSTPEAQAALTALPESRTPDAIADLAVKSMRAIGSDASVRNSDDQIRAKAKTNLARSDRPMGVARQYAAILAQPRWHDRLPSVTQPTLVLHGAIDPLIKPEAGRDIANRVPGAKLEVVDKWGHDMPEAMVDTLLGLITPFLDANS